MTLLDRLRQAVSRPAPSDLLPGDVAMDSDWLAAAVLIAVSDLVRPSVILTVRRAELRRHAGQIAFPGGRIDAHEDAVAAALREAEEEVGLDPALVRIAGTLDAYTTITGYRVVPVIGVIPPHAPLVPHQAEVADIFEAPLDHLLAAENHVRRTMLFEGQERHYYEIMWEGRRIWGATAAMIINLSKRLRLP